MYDFVNLKGFDLSDLRNALQRLDGKEPKALGCSFLRQSDYPQIQYGPPTPEYYGWKPELLPSIEWEHELGKRYQLDTVILQYVILNWMMERDRTTEISPNSYSAWHDVLQRGAIRKRRSKDKKDNTIIDTSFLERENPTLFRIPSFCIRARLLSACKEWVCNSQAFNKKDSLFFLLPIGNTFFQKHGLMTEAKQWKCSEEDLCCFHVEDYWYYEQVSAVNVSISISAELMLLEKGEDTRSVYHNYIEPITLELIKEVYPFIHPIPAIVWKAKFMRSFIKECGKSIAGILNKKIFPAEDGIWEGIRAKAEKQKRQKLKNILLNQLRAYLVGKAKLHLFPSGFRQPSPYYRIHKWYDPSAYNSYLKTAIQANRHQKSDEEFLRAQLAIVRKADSEQQITEGKFCTDTAYYDYDSDDDKGRKSFASYFTNYIETLIGESTPTFDARTKAETFFIKVHRVVAQAITPVPSIAHDNSIVRFVFLT